jgi:hypothetical protein
MVTLKKLYLLLVIFCSTLHAQYVMSHSNHYYLPEKWPEHRLQFSKRGTLMDIYNAGLRPYYRPNDQTSSRLEFKHVRLYVRQSNGNYLPLLAVERAEVTVLTKGLSLLTIFGQAMTLEEAYSQTLPWLPIVGKSDAQLKDFLSKVKADYSGFDDRDFGSAPDSFKTTWYGQEKERYTFVLAKAWNEQVPLRMELYISWHKHWNDGDRKTHREHMPPPVGYENEPIQIIKKGFGPDSMNEMMWAKGIPFGPNRGLGGYPSDVIEIDDKGNPLREMKETSRKVIHAPKAAPADDKMKGVLPSYQRYIFLIAVTMVIFALLHAFKKRRMNL